jgi:2-polyprenyl-6-methoxyphenol hydroxylase-like FAD-dependent oxidoreductase
MDENESIRRPRTDTVLRLSVRLDRLAQLASPTGCRLRNAVVRRVPQGARGPGFEAIRRHQL